MSTAKNNRGAFIVFDGPDGVGKTIQAVRLSQYLKSQNVPVFSTREPGGTDIFCAAIREVLLDPRYENISSRAELLLFEANRAQHVEVVIRPKVESGVIVVSDRFEASSFAYQCFARGICSPEEFFAVNAFATDWFAPDFTFWIDLDLEISRRRNALPEKNDRFEKEHEEFHRKVHDGFHIFFERYVSPDRWTRLDGAQSIETISAEAIAILEKKGIIKSNTP